MSRIRVGLVGAGFMGSVHAEAWAACDQVELAAVAAGPGSPPRALAEQYGARACADLAELLEQVEVVDICAPTHLHRELTEAAAAAGRAVICEKPLARTPGEGQRMIDACIRAGVPLLAAHVVRFFPEYSTARSAVTAGDIGEPAVLRLTRATFQPDKAEGNWYTDPEKSGGLVLDLMVHDFDYARWVAGDVESVHARSVAAARRRRGVAHSGADHVLAILRHTSGAISHVQGSWAYPRPVFRTAGEIAGTAGVLDFDSDRTAPLRPRLRTDPESGEVPLPASPLAESPYTVQLRHFAQVLRGEAEPVVTAADGLAALWVADAAARSIASGATVKVEVPW